MQSGAFIQLVLTLVAIVSRMDILTSELQDALRLTWSAAHRVLQILDVSARCIHSSPSNFTGSRGTEISVFLCPFPTGLSFSRD